MEKLGSYLKKEREARNCSLEEISSVIKVRKGILEAIENDNYTLLPPPVFVKGFLRAYARHLGLDQGEVMKRYQEVAGEFTDEEGEGGKKERDRFPFKRLLVPVTAGVIVLTLILYLVALRPSSTEKNEEGKIPPPVAKLEEKKSAEIREPVSMTDTSAPSQTPSQSESGTAIAEDSEARKLNLLFKAKEETWVGFKVDDEKSSQVLLQAGDTYVMRADRIIRLKIGNAGGVDLSLNGKLFSGLGKSGEVVNLTLTEENL
jgi:cytoskeletal protein RodZ